MNKIRQSWSAFSPDIAAEYLKTFGAPALGSKEILCEVLQKQFSDSNPRILDFGCGNGQLFEFFKTQDFACDYTGIDFSDSLIDVARAQNPEAEFIVGDVNQACDLVSGRFDCVIYSHVFEILESPELSLQNAKKLSSQVLIRFFEPPEYEVDTVELKEMDLGLGSVPYLRRKMSKSYYQLILANAGCKKVDVYKDTTRDQVHLLYF